MPDPARPAPVRPEPMSAARKTALMALRRRRGTGFWFGVAIDALWPFVMHGTRIGWSGGEHLPRTGGVLLAMNHVSFADPLFDTAYVLAHGRVPRFLAKAELWDSPVVRSVLAGGGHIPVHRDSARATDAFRGAVAALERGEVVCFYPEGTYTRDPDGWPMAAKNGIGRIAVTTGVPVVPVANWGTQRFLPPGTGRPRFVPRAGVSIVAGPPVDLSAYVGGRRTRTNLDGATATIMGAVTDLLGRVRGRTPPQRSTPAPGAGAPGVA